MSLRKLFPELLKNFKLQNIFLSNFSILFYSLVKIGHKFPQGDCRQLPVTCYTSLYQLVLARNNETFNNHDCFNRVLVFRIMKCSYVLDIFYNIAAIISLFNIEFGNYCMCKC